MRKPYLFFTLIMTLILSVNAQGRTVLDIEIIHETDNAKMRLISAGDYIMGSPAESSEREDEIPAHPVKLDAFYMDVFEVTNAQYAKFLEDNTGHPAPLFWNDPQFKGVGVK